MNDPRVYCCNSDSFALFPSPPGLSLALSCSLIQLPHVVRLATCSYFHWPFLSWYTHRSQQAERALVAEEAAAAIKATAEKAAAKDQKAAPPASGGCCQDDSGGSAAGGGGCCQHEGAANADAGGCCQDESAFETTPSIRTANSSAQSAGGGCCQDSEGAGDSGGGGGGGGCCQDPEGAGDSGGGGGGCCKDDGASRPGAASSSGDGGCCSSSTTSMPTSKRARRKKKAAAAAAAAGPSAEEVLANESDVLTGLKVLYGTTKGTSEGFANELVEQATMLGMEASAVFLEDYEPESLQDETSVVIFILPTYEGGTPPPSAAWFHKWLNETRTDFRIDSRLLSSVRYAVFGLGDSHYDNNYCTVGSQVDMWMAELAAVRIAPLACGDQNTIKSLHKGQRADFLAWMEEMLPAVEDVLASPWNFRAGPAMAQMMDSDDDEEGCGTGDGNGNGDGDGDGADEGGESSSAVEAIGGCGPTAATASEADGGGLLDLEDMGSVVKRMGMAGKRRKEEDAAAGTTEAREMVTPELRKELTKQGYKIIGSHSGVKLCRWTKSMLRGRGGCYKHTFYGIESHQCMETTPSLACANKCVFCWRHHTNPVGTSWRWKMDDPLMIVDGAMQKHYDSIKQFRGVPGVIPSRFKEANQIKHCALSLVGEPIMYPEINKFLDILHSRRISSFLVTNAQFPECITNLHPVCQLYVSIDASTEESLRKIDRPLFSDFWPRFKKCLVALADKGQRTVYRLTIVKAWNDDEVKNYADLVALGKPSFIEVKGVTFCGDSKASSLTMGNVPWHDEVINFVETLVEMLPGYTLCSEHEHSNSLLIASDKFLVDGRWHTWIDYDRFHELVGQWEEDGTPFKSEDYMAPTPDWAIAGSPERGFDPIEVRHHRKKPVKNVHGC